MVQRLLAPATDPRGDGESAQWHTSELDKVALRDRIAIRRKDDMIRRREFSYLRKVRAQSQRGLPAEDLPSPSLFNNSSSFIQEDLSPQDRARTVKKIDAIEAHMAQLWAQKRRPAPAPSSEASARESLKAAFNDPGEMVDMDLDFTVTRPFEPEVATQPAGLSPQPSPPQAPPVATTSAPAQAARQKAPSADAHPSVFASGFSNSLMTSVELGDELDNPALHEAAIRFAEGDDSGAEAALLAVVQAAGADAEVANICATALLDLYRATDQAASFEEVAIDYAQRFGRSAPEWFSVPQRLRRGATPSMSASPTPSGASPTGAWECPPELTLPAVQALRTSQRHANAHHLRWDALRTIHADAVPALNELFREWAGLPLDLHFSGEEVLNAVLEAATPPADPGTDPLRWHLRLEALRIQGLHDAFESVALDYCVVYELSPPSWQEADCTCVCETQDTASTDSTQGAASMFPPPDETPAPTATLLELRGELLGDAVQALDELHARVSAGSPMVISLALVIRVDFSAAGSILNWLSTHLGETGKVQFVQAPRLVAAFFHVMGIAEVAGVSTVKNG